MEVGALELVGVVGGELSLETETRGSRRFLGGATASDMGGESECIPKIEMKIFDKIYNSLFYIY